MTERKELTDLEAAVAAMLRRPGGIPTDDARADFLIRAFGDPSGVIEMVFNRVDWEAISTQLHQRE